MPDNFEPDPNISPCVNCIWRNRFGDNSQCLRCMHRNKKFRPTMGVSHK